MMLKGASGERVAEAIQDQPGPERGQDEEGGLHDMDPEEERG